MEPIENKDLLIHDYTRKSLREYLVPIKEWILRVDAIESYGDMRVLPVRFDELREDLYIADYPFTTPLYIEYLQDVFHTENVSPSMMEKLSEHDIERWAKTVRARVGNFVDHAIADVTISLIDGNFSYGCVLSQTTGAIFPFDYNEVVDFQFISVPLEVERHMAGFALSQHRISPAISKEDVGLHLQWLNENRNRRFGWFRPIFATKYGDIFNGSDCQVLISGALPQDPEIIENLNQFLRSGFNSHAKVIRVM